MKKLCLFCFVLSLICPLTDVGQEKAEGCTIGVASGKATADGRPLLWKNLDAGYGPREVVYFKDGRFKYLAIAPANDSWISAGVNEFGLCVAHALAFDLEGKSKTGMWGNSIMKLALQQCVTVDDFESLLKQTNISGRTTACNVGVIDAFGGAAIFETGNYSYTRFDATDPKIAPYGFVIRANFALTADGNSGRTRYERANELWEQAVEKNQLDYHYVLREVCRDLSDAENATYTQQETREREDTSVQVLNNENAVSRPGTRCVTVFHGVKPDESPSLTTFWAIMGEPIFCVAVPSWVIAESTARELDGEQYSPICTVTHDLYLANYVIGDKRRPLLNLEMLTEIKAITYPAEDKIFDHTESIMAQWRQDYPTAQEVASFHRSMASEAMSALEDTTEMLMKKGGPTASLRLALYMRSAEKARAFIEGGADINVWDSHGYTPLHYAVENNIKEIVQLLISKNADINAKHKSGQTPLDIAINQDRKELLKLLMSKGATTSSIFAAARIGDAAGVKAFLEQGVNVNARGARRRTALHIAAGEGYKELVELLLEHGADINAGTNSNQTAAGIALWARHNEIVELLMSKGADVSPLHLAISMGDEAKAKSLIEGGADVNKRTPDGTTPLHIAAHTGLRKTVELLIQHHANVNVTMPWDWMPLHSAVEKGYKEIVELLVTNGANIDAREGEGSTPLMRAKDKGLTEIAEILRKHGATE